MALAAVKGEKTLAELAQQYDVHSMRSRLLRSMRRPAKIAVTAVVRKLVATANALLKADRLRVAETA